MQTAHQQGSAPISILVVEDNPLNMKLLVGILRKLGHDPAMVDNGEGSVHMAAEQSFDLILMDVMMSGVDGLEATRRIRQLPIRQPVIIAVTANTMVGEKEKCLEAGMDDYSVKPISIQQIKSILDRSQQIIAQKKLDTAMGPNTETLDLLDMEVIESLQFLAEDGPEFLIETLELYSSKAEECLEHIFQGTEAGDATLVAAQAHSFRGAGSNVGVVKLAGVLRQIEHFAKEQNLEAVRPLLTNLTSLHQQSLQALKQALQLS